MHLERAVALGIAEYCAPAPRAGVDGEDQIAAHGEHGSSGRDASQTAEWRLRLVAEAREGVGRLTTKLTESLWSEVGQTVQ